MPEFADIYVLGKERKADAINAFLDHYLPLREESADEYEVPQYSKSPKHVFKDAKVLIDYCCANKNEAYSVYWQHLSNDFPQHVMVFFLSDGGIVFGISTPSEDSEKVDQISIDLGGWFKTKEVIVTYEDLPPDSIETFKAFFDSLPEAKDKKSADAVRRLRAHKPIKF